MGEEHEIVIRARKLLMALAWTQSALARPAASVTVHLAARIPTAAVDARGRIYLNADFCGKLPADELSFVLAHEILHVLFEHFGRQGSRENERWNRATDRAINHSLRLMGLKAPACALFPLPNMPENGSAEELYELEPEDAGGAGGDGEALPTAGCGVMGRGGEAGEEESDGEGETDDEARAAGQQAAAVWRQIAIETVIAARQAGKNELGALITLLDIPAARVRWIDILRHAISNAVAGAGRDDVSWSRKSRRGAALGCVLPGGVTTRAAIAVVIDASGSVDDKALGHAVAETCAAVTASGRSAYLVVHDAAVQWQGWIQPGTSPARIANDCLKGRGGTAFQPAYDAVAAVPRGKFGTLVHLTDGMPCDEWPAKPANCRKVVVGLIGLHTSEHVPDYARTVMVESFRDRSK
jgi:predicted metal-dependent peptidase